MKSIILKIFIGIVISLIYIPLSITISFISFLFINNIFSPNEISYVVVLAGFLVATVIMFFTAYFLSYMLKKEKIKLVNLKHRVLYVFVCCLVPVSVICSYVVYENISISKLQQTNLAITNNLGLELLVKNSLNVVSAILLLICFAYATFFVMYIISNLIVNRKKD